jgi:hypothetical protein
VSRVRGKGALTLNFVKEVHANSYQQRVTIHVKGFDGVADFDAEGTLETHCVRNLILDLRRALRQIRDESAKRLDSQVADAEKPL